MSDQEIKDIRYQVECITRDLVLFLMERRSMNMTEALETVYNSDTLRKLEDPECGLFFQSSGYVYSFLESELDNGKIQ